jgi:hypothetical protein
MPNSCPINVGERLRPPAELDEKHKNEMPLERNDDPGHTA